MNRLNGGRRRAATVTARRIRSPLSPPDESVQNPVEEHQVTKEVYEARLALLYDKATAAYTLFLEWRHKVILLASTTMGLVVGGTSWMYKERLGGLWIAFPLTAGSVLFLSFRQFDRRNGMLLQACYEACTGIERLFTMEHQPAELSLFEGVFTRLLRSREADMPYEPKRGNYGWILRRFYTWTAAVLAGLACAAIIVGVIHGTTLVPGETATTIHSTPAPTTSSPTSVP
jgi:hypothetical protein